MEKKNKRNTILIVIVLIVLIILVGLLIFFNINKDNGVKDNSNTYTVRVKTRNGLVDGVSNTSKVVKENGSVSFKLDAVKGFGYESNDCDGVVKDDTITFSNITNNKECTIIFKEVFSLKDAILRDNPNVKTGTEYGLNTSVSKDTIYLENKAGFTQDNKPVYYFSGDVKNNYVKFAGYYWRIVRINEDDSVRLIYAGKTWDDPDGFIGESAFNTNSDKSYYSGYMYNEGEQHGLSTSSTIKTIVDEWYKNNLLNNYDKFISKTAIYCNDRDVVEGAFDPWRDTSGAWSINGESFSYSSEVRAGEWIPSLKCSSVTDQFTVKNNKKIGNQSLTYPVGLITADEVMFAGAKWGNINKEYYLRQNAQNNYWWTMSSASWHNEDVSVLYVFPTGNLHNSNVGSLNGIRPVISLKSCVLTNGGNGTNIDPYTITINEKCALLDN